MSKCRKNLISLLVTAILISLAIGMNESEAQQLDFRITYPTDGQIVPGRIVSVVGVGASAGPGTRIEVSVLTNQWYPQDGQFEINSDGSWNYAPCHLAGTGPYNNHTIKARLIGANGVIASSIVHGVIRKGAP